MKKEPLSKTNRYLRNNSDRNRILRQQVIDSSAVEGIDAARLNKILPAVPENIKPQY